MAIKVLANDPVPDCDELDEGDVDEPDGLDDEEEEDEDKDCEDEKFDEETDDEPDAEEPEGPLEDELDDGEPDVDEPEEAEDPEELLPQVQSNRTWTCAGVPSAMAGEQFHDEELDGMTRCS